jgi:alpha-L-fucosidase
MGDGAVVPYEADVLQGIGKWLHVNGKAIYATKEQPFDKLDFGYATVGSNTLYLLVDRVPADGVLRLPGVVESRFGAATVLGGDGAAAPVMVDKDGASIDTRPLQALRSGAYLPVIAVPLQSNLNFRPTSIPPDAQGRAHLSASNARRFLNYNGYGYEDPNTVYKLLWYSGLGTGRYRATLRYQPTATKVQLDLVIDGHSRLVRLSGSGSTVIDVVRDAAASPYAMRVELTPAEPFHKGDRLPVGIEAIDFEPSPR